MRKPTAKRRLSVVRETRNGAAPAIDTVLRGSAEDLTCLGDGTVALTVTSPPYWNAIDYDRHTENPKEWYRTRKYSQGFKEYGEYLGWLTRIMGGVLEKTKPGGFAGLIIGTVLLDGQHLPVPFQLTAELCKIGWDFHQDIIWHKVTGGVKRAGVFIQKPYPGYFYPNIMTEYILVFRKPGPSIFREKSAADKKAAQVPIDRLFTQELANTVWHIAPVPPGHLDHPCPFPEEIPYRLIQLYSYPGDLVFDPFCGSGQTLKVAKHLGRPFLGLDTSAKYVKYAASRLNEPLSVRPRQLTAAFEKIDIGTPLLGPTRGNGKTRTGKRPKALVKLPGFEPAQFALLDSEPNGE